MSAHSPNHDYHLVNPSPWPALGSISAFIMAFGAVWYMHPDMFGGFLAGAGVWKLLLGLLMVLLVMFFWWRDIIGEGRQGDHTPVVQLGLRYGMTLFIASEVMFFVAFFWGFFNSSLGFDSSQNFGRLEAIGGVWPPAGIQTFDPFELPLMNTLILLLSGCTVTWAHHALREGKRDQAIQGMLLTVLLGISFTALQAFEYSHAGFGFTDGIYASVFYMATGFHGFHVIVGTIFLLVCLLRLRAGHFSPSSHFGVEAAIWYWHFVDVVWLFLFVSIYWWGS